MMGISKVIDPAADDLDRRISEREADAEMLPPGALRQSVLKEVAQLRASAAAKRWMEPQTGK